MRKNIFKENNITYLKTVLFTTVFLLAAGSSAHAGDVMKPKMETMNAKPAPAASAQILTKANDTIGEVLQADGQPDEQKDFEILTHDGDMMTKQKARLIDSDSRIDNNAIVVPSSSGAITTVSCPIGTTAKPDMTCHVTGNFDLERMTALKEADSADRSFLK